MSDGLYKWLYKKDAAYESISFALYAQDHIKDTHQGEAPAGLTSEKIVVAFIMVNS
jgi:hypothetical protein